MQSASMLSLELLSIDSAYSLFVSAMPLFVSLSLDASLNRGGLLVNLWTYALGMFVPLLGGTKMACIVLDVFVPLVCSTAFPSSSAFYIILSDTLNHRLDVSVQTRLRNISSRPSSHSYYLSLYRSSRPSRTDSLDAYV